MSSRLFFSRRRRNFATGCGESKIPSIAFTMLKKVPCGHSFGTLPSTARCLARQLPKTLTRFFIQIRLPNGEHIEDSFDELDPLSVIAEVVKSKLGSQKFLLSIPFPRRIFTDQDLHDVTLKDAGLAPKGLLIAQLGIATDMKQDTTPAARPGGVKHVKSAREYEALKATPNKLVVVDFTAEWCGYVPCRIASPQHFGFWIFVWFFFFFFALRVFVFIGRLLL
jgi:thiol-disulfide isomerase/thioredoxin